MMRSTRTSLMFFLIVSSLCVEITPGYSATRRSGKPAFLPMALTVSAKPLMAMVTLGMPLFSATRLARELADVQLPHPPFPEMTASHSYSFSFSGSSLIIRDSSGPYMSPNFSCGISLSVG